MCDPNPNRLRVLHYLDAVREEAGGVVRCVIDLCRVLADHGVVVTLATLDTKDIPSEWQDLPNPPQVRQLSLGLSDFDPSAMEADVAHLHTPWDRTNAKLAKMLRASNVPYVVSAHGMLDDWCMDQKRLKKRAYLWLQGQQLLERAYRVHCTAQGEEQQASKWYPAGKSTVLPLVVDLPNQETLPGPQLAIDAFPPLAIDHPKVLFLSRLHPKKGIEVLLPAVARAVERGCELELFIAGPGEERYVDSLQALADQLQIADRTHFLGLVQGQEKLSLYQACDLFVLPTHQENFGLVLPEAMACRTPVVTTKGVDIWPEIEAGGGVIVDNHSESLAEQLVRLLADRDALAKRGVQGRDFVYDWLDPHRVVQGYIDLYRETASSSK